MPLGTALFSKGFAHHQHSHSGVQAVYSWLQWFEQLIGGYGTPATTCSTSTASSLHASACRYPLREHSSTRSSIFQTRQDIPPTHWVLITLVTFGKVISLTPGTTSSLNLSAKWCFSSLLVARIHFLGIEFVCMKLKLFDIRMEGCSQVASVQSLP